MELYRVLLVDDEEDIREGISRKMDWLGLGFSLVGEAANGQDALELAETLRPDVILTDIKMPIMDGIALALAAARDFPDLTILLMTGFADQRERASGLDAIVHDVITKPFAVADIRTAVADALASRSRA